MVGFERNGDLTTTNRSLFQTTRGTIFKRRKGGQCGRGECSKSDSGPRTRKNGRCPAEESRAGKSNAPKRCGVLSCAEYPVKYKSAGRCAPLSHCPCFGDRHGDYPDLHSTSVEATHRRAGAQDPRRCFSEDAP